MSDHLPTYFIFKNNKCFTKKEIKYKRCLKQFVLEEFLTDLEIQLSKINMEISDTNVNSDICSKTTIFKEI